MFKANGTNHDQTRLNELAIHGGVPAISQPLPPMYPGGMRIGYEEEEAVMEVLRSKRLFRYYGPVPGPSKVETLEKVFAKDIGTSYCVAVSSGTAALTCALTSFAIGPGDEVIVPAFTWISTATSVLAVGAVPILAEVDESLTLDPTDVARKITYKTKAIIAVHMRGAPCAMTELMRLSKAHNLRLLEDVAQAAGGSFQGRKLGSFGDAGAFSLQFNKIITSGEGGLITTSDNHCYMRMLMYQDVVNGWRNNIPLEQILPGVNLRMSELQGAVALVQFGRLNRLLEEMRLHKARIKANMVDIARQKGITFCAINDVEGDTAIALIFYLPTVDQTTFVAKALNCEGVKAEILYEPENIDYHVYAHWSSILNKQTWSTHGGPWYWHGEEVNYYLDMCPRTLDLLGRAVHLDISPDLTEHNIEEIGDALDKVLAFL